MEILVVSPLGLEYSEGVLDLFGQEWWTNSRSLSDVELLVSGSTSTVGLVDGEQLVAFARVLSDGFYLALILDVIVDQEHRGLGLGDRLLEAVLALPKVRSVKSAELICQPELFVFYERHGFSTNVGRSTLMRRTSDPSLQS